MAERRLTAILSADVAGYSGLMEADEAGTLARLKQVFAGVFEPRVAAHKGRIVKFMGDGALVAFASAADAVSCALAVQQTLAAGADPIRMRIGVNLGDVIVDGDDIFGNDVNIAARLQTLAAPGGVTLSRTVYERIAGKIDAVFEDAGQHQLKNLEQSLHVFAWGGAPRASLRVAVCVLPFANMSGDPEQEYFSDGISEDIITDLSKVSTLAVVSRNTAFSFKGKHVKVVDVARQLKATHVLEGSVRKAGKRVRITAQLIDGRSDAHVWAERWDRDLDDIFALQDEISQAIVAALKLKLAPEERKAIERRGTTNTEAYELYLMARNSYITDNMTDSRRADTVARLCCRAIDLDPNYASAWAMLALAQRAQSYAGEEGDSGLAAAERALELDPTVVEAHGARIGALVSANDFAKAQEAVDFALALDPDNYEVNKEAGRLAFRRHRHADAIPYYEKAAAAADNDFSSTGLLMSCCQAVGDKAGLRSAAQRTLARTEAILARDPNHGSALSMGIGALTALGQTERAKEWAARALIVDPDNLNMRYNIACAFVLDLKEYDTALDLLEPVFAKIGRDRLAHAETDPDFDAIRPLPRFKAMLAAAQARVAGEAN